MKFYFRLFLILIFSWGLVIAGPTPKAHAIPEKIYRSLDLFTKVLYLVERDYVEEVDGEELVYGAIKGMLGTLDPYSVFLTPDVYKELKVDTVGRFGGVGLEITLREGVLTVVAPIEDTPADRAGIQSGDKIVKINGTSTKGMNLVDAVRRMRGSKKSKVTLTIVREGIKKPFDVALRRETIKIKSVKPQLLPSGIVYIRMTNFQENTQAELAKKLKALAKKSGGMKGIILDLRNNPGGLLDEAVGVSDLFLKSGTIVSTRGRGAETEVKIATGGQGYYDVPLVVLINKGSASASEIVAGAIQDRKRGKVIGSTSFGKGSVQTVIELGEGTGLKLTIAKYYTPGGKTIEGKGVTPDFEVTNPKDLGMSIPLDAKKDRPRQAAEVYILTGEIPDNLKEAPKEEEKEEDKGSKE